MNKDETLGIRISKDDKKLLEEDATREHRSKGSFLLWAWRRWREKQDFERKI